MANNQKIECPECGSKISVWIDVDTSVSFEVGKSGKLSKRSIEEDTNGEGRCGVKCTNDECDFEMHSHDDESGEFSAIFEIAYDELAELEITLRRPRA